jgi:uncharacterized repeat protein (TIGR01451 family)
VLKGYFCVKIPLMKKLYFLVLLLCFYGLNAQVITFGSTPFKDRLLSANATNGFAKDINGNNIVVDSNFDKEINAVEASKVYFLELGGTKSTIYNLMGIEFFVNLKTLNFYGQRVTADLRPLKNLERINCGGDLVTKDLNINGLNLKEIRAESSLSIMPYLLDNGPTGISQFANLEVLFLGGDRLETINLQSLKSLKTLMITRSKIKSLDLSNQTNLEFLYCNNNLLTDLDLTSCKNITGVEANLNNFTTILVKDLPKLEYLRISENSTLSELSLVNTPNLKSLDVYKCSLTDLNLSNLVALESINCSNNKLTNLNIKGSINLLNISCDNNLIKELDLSLCKKFESLYAGYNKFESLEFYGKLGSYLNISNNLNLKYLSIKNGIINQSSIEFANCPNLKYICVDENDNEIATVQNLIKTYKYTDCHVNSYCNFHPGEDYFVIQGSQRIDSNKNGCDNSDPFYPNLKFNIVGASSGTFVNNLSGNYSIPVLKGTHKITPVLENPWYFSVTPATATIVFPAQTSPYTQNFCITPVGTYRDLEVTILPIDVARPGFDAKYKIVYKNKGNVVQSGSIKFVFDDAILEYVSSNTAFSSKSVNAIEWSFAAIQPFESREIVFTLKSNKPTDLPAVNNGDVIKLTATIASQDKDESPIDNTFTLNQVVVGSYDPNDKTCLEGSVITPELIGEYVHYMIRFENTGTFAAENIVVKDMIDLSKFDLTTLVPTSSSHPFTTKITAGNKVEFIFEKINLPFDDANNDGYVAFKIKTRSNLRVGDTFANEANIYFDYNFPILTNKATSTFKTVTLGTPDFEFSSYFTLYPNPANHTLNINSKEGIEIQSLSIYDMLGQLVIAVPNAKSVSTIDVSKLSSGNYFIKIKSDKGSSGMKFIKY